MTPEKNNVTPLWKGKDTPSGGGEGNSYTLMGVGSGGGNGHGSDMQERVAKLETHFEYIRKDLDEIKSGLGAVVTGMEAMVRNNPTKADLYAWKVQWTAICVGAVAIIVGGIIGGLGWIKPDASPPPPVTITAPAPVIVQVPSQPPAP